MCWAIDCKSRRRRGPCSTQFWKRTQATFAALASRAVLKAHQGDRDGAASDAVAALKGDDDPLIILQAACAFARSAADQPADKEKALHLAARAIGAKPELGKIAAADPDLEFLA